jgi:hypothetical protein
MNIDDVVKEILKRVSTKEYTMPYDLDMEEDINCMMLIHMVHAYKTGKDFSKVTNYDIILDIYYRLVINESMKKAMEPHKENSDAT